MLPFFCALLSQAAAKDAVDIQATLKEDPGAAPILRVEGTTSLPDGAVLRLSTYFTKVELSREMGRITQVRIREGKFAKDFALYGERNLRGRHVIRVEYDPSLQPVDIYRKYPRRHAVDASLQIGTVVEAEQDRKKFHERLAGEVKEIAACCDKIHARYGEVKGGPFDRQAWSAFLQEIVEGMRRIYDRAQKVAEYRAFYLDGIAALNLYDLRRDIYALGVAYASLLANPPGNQDLRGILAMRRSIDRQVESLLVALSTETGDPQRLSELTGEIRRILREALGLNAGDVGPARRRFQQAVLALHAQALDVKALQEAIGTLAAEGGEFFDVLETDRELALKLHDPLDRKIEKILEEILRPK